MSSAEQLLPLQFRAPQIRARDRRLVLQLLGYWQSVSSAGGPPLVSDFRRTDLDDLWTDCFALTLAPDDGESLLSDVGETIAAMSGVEQSGIPLAAIAPGTLLASALRPMPQVALSGAPSLDDGEFTDGLGRRFLYRSVLLPFVDGAGAVRTIIGGARCKRVDRAADDEAGADVQR